MDYTYDLLNRRTNEQLDGNGGDNFSYDATDQLIHVDYANGTAWGDGSQSRPINYLPDGLFPETRRIKLLGNYTPNAAIGSPGTTIDSNGYTLGTAVSGTLDVDEGFEGGSKPTNWNDETVGGGALPDYTHAAAPSPHGGSRAGYG